MCSFWDCKKISALRSGVVGRVWGVAATVSLHLLCCIILEVIGGGIRGRQEGVTHGGGGRGVKEECNFFNLICYLQGRYRCPRSVLSVPGRYK